MQEAKAQASLRSLARAFAAHQHKVTTKMKSQTTY